MLAVTDLTVHYRGRPALTGFSLAMGEGEIVALVGESGSGKTTAIRALMGLLPPGGEVTAGSAAFEGQELLALAPRQWQALRGTRMSMIFQDSGAMLNPIRTIGGQFVEYLRAHQSMGKKDAWERSLTLLGQMGLPNPESIAGSYPFQLSGGQRQRVGIAMAMAFQPKLLLADEPTSALDVTTQAQIVRQMMELREQRGTAILLVTHNLGVASYMADRILVMKAGAVVDRLTPEELPGREAGTYTRQLLDAVPDMRRERYV